MYYIIELLADFNAFFSLLYEMETINDFLKDLKDRLTNPLISSFVMVWLLANWPITIGLLLYKIKDLERDGYMSYYMLIRCNYSFANMIVIPSVGALIYTFIFPYIKAFIKLNNAEIIAGNDTDIQKITKDGTMPVMKFITLKDEHTAVIQKLNALYDSESEMLKQITQLKEDKAELTLQLTKEKNQNENISGYLGRVQSSAEKTIISGLWSVIITEEDGNTSQHAWDINDSTIGQENGETYIISDFILNPFTSMFLIRFHLSGDLKNHFTYIMKGNNDLTTINSYLSFGDKSLYMSKIIRS